MASNRIGRINEEIQRELSALIRTVKDPRVGETMVSITLVETTPDLRYAKIHISCLEKNKAKDVMKGLRSASGYLRRELGRNLRLRYTPELQFQEDDSIIQGAHILELIEGLDISHDDEEEPSDEE
jgi:ribosome-binding factor A